MHNPNIRRNYCKHDNGFTGINWEGLKGGGMYVCNLNCGYALNFNPFEYPGGITYVEVPPARFTKTQGTLKRSKY